MIELYSIRYDLQFPAQRARDAFGNSDLAFAYMNRRSLSELQRTPCKVRDGARSRYVTAGNRMA